MRWATLEASVWLTLGPSSDTLSFASACAELILVSSRFWKYLFLRVLAAAVLPALARRSEVRSIWLSAVLSSLITSPEKLASWDTRAFCTPTRRGLSVRVPAGRFTPSTGLVSPRAIEVSRSCIILSGVCASASAISLSYNAVSPDCCATSALSISRSLWALAAMRISFTAPLLAAPLLTAAIKPSIDLLTAELTPPTLLAPEATLPPSIEPINSAPMMAQGLSPRPTASVNAASPAAVPEAAVSTFLNLVGLAATSATRGLLRPMPTLAVLKSAAAGTKFSVRTLPTWNAGLNSGEISFLSSI